MAYIERAINLVFYKISGETITADAVFKTQKDSFEIRRKYQVGEIDLYCLECDQKMGVSTSNLDRG